MDTITIYAYKSTEGMIWSSSPKDIYEKYVAELPEGWALHKCSCGRIGLKTPFGSVIAPHTALVTRNGIPFLAACNQTKCVFKYHYYRFTTIKKFVRLRQKNLQLCSPQK